MNRPLLIIGILCISAGSAAQPPVAATSSQMPTDAIKQSAACADQPKSLKELINAFNSGQSPSPSQVTGAWVAIGFTGDFSSFNCSGVTRGRTFEWVMVANQYSIEIDMIGSHVQVTALTPANQAGLALPVDFEGDSVPIYRCRRTDRGTLACLFGEPDWIKGVEFKKMPVRADQRANHKVDAQ